MIRSEFESVCRLCIERLKEDNLINIFNYQINSNEVTLPEKIKFCCGVKIEENDGYPSQICQNCLVKLKQFFIFRNQCVLADWTFKHLVENKEYKLDDVINLVNVDFEKEIFSSYTNFMNIFDKYVAINSDNSIKSTEKDKNENFKDELHQLKSCSEDISYLICNKNTKESSFDEIKNHETKKNISPDKNYCSKTKTEQKITKFEKVIKPLKKTKKNKNKENRNECFSFNCESANTLTNANNECEIKEVKALKRKNKIFDIGISKNVMKPLTKIKKIKTLEMTRGSNKKDDKVKEKPTSYTCDYCQKVYPSEGGWRYHVHTMHDANYQPFICDLCGQSFKVKKNLEGHKNSIHFRLKLNLCDVCGRGFASKYALKVHKIWHNDEKDFACDVCGTRFRTRGKLNTHKSIHGGPKNFMCHICSRNFRWKKDFEVHVRTHTGEKPFKCSHCGKAFASLTNMRKHERNDRNKMIDANGREPETDLKNLNGSYLDLNLCPQTFLND